MSTPVRVLIADDQALARKGLRMILEVEADLEVVGEAADGQQALLVAAETQPDVVLMDVRMPGMDGLEATRRLLVGGDRDPRVIILTTFDLDDYVYEALRAGASGFILKDMPPEQLVAAIHTVAQGESLVSPAITRRLIEAFVQQPPDGARTSPPELDQLTPRETDIMRLIARGLSNAEIAAAAFVTEPTVKTHVARILMKLGLRDRVQVVVYAYEHRLV
jgi:DNA-binding NarL/FixJ family response regulator